MKSNLELMQNVVKPYIDAKNQALTNYVTETGVKNLLPMTISGLKAINTAGTWSGNVYTYKGGTFEVLVDSADNVVGINIDGTFTGNTGFYLIRNYTTSKIYVLSGARNGSDSTYFIEAYNGSSYTFQYSDGIDLPADTYNYIAVGARGGTYNNVKVYPMMRDASIIDPTYAPYAKTNLELMQDIAGLFDLVAQGGNNLIDGTTAFTTLENLKVYTMTTGNPWESDGYNASVFVLKSFSNMGYQVAFKLLSATGAAEMAIRQCYNGIYGTWKKVTST